MIHTLTQESSQDASGVTPHSLQILGLLDSFIKTDYPDPEVLILQIK